MALFGTKQKKTETKSVQPKAADVRKAAEQKNALGRLEGVLRHPWMSEKALMGTDKGVYVFAIPFGVTKEEVRDAVSALYSVVPKKVRVGNLPGKSKNLRHKRGTGMRARRRKAYVYLKEGETITF